MRKTKIRCSGTNTKVKRESDRKYRPGRTERLGAPVGSFGMASVRPPSHFPISAVAPTATSTPTSSRVTTYCHGNTRARNTSTAGFRSGFPTQYANAAPLDTPDRRKPAATGAAQQVHIMLGIDKVAPTRDYRRGGERVNRRTRDRKSVV